MSDVGTLYSEKVMEHFRNPRNVGDMENPDGIGHVGNPVCGDIMELYIKVKNNIITGEGECAIYVEPWGGDAYGDWIFYNNDVSGFDAEEAPIYLGPATNDCIVVGGISYSDYVWDDGTDNVILELDEDDLEDWEDYFED